VCHGVQQQEDGAEDGAQDGEVEVAVPQQAVNAATLSVWGARGAQQAVPPTTSWATTRTCSWKTGMLPKV
jgi:hypothetical protein